MEDFLNVTVLKRDEPVADDGQAGWSGIDLMDHPRHVVDRVPHILVGVADRQLVADCPHQERRMVLQLQDLFLDVLELATDRFRVAVVELVDRLHLHRQIDQRGHPEPVCLIEGAPVACPHRVRSTCSEVFHWKAAGGFEPVNRALDEVGLAGPIQPEAALLLPDFHFSRGVSGRIGVGPSRRVVLKRRRYSRCGRRDEHGEGGECKAGAETGCHGGLSRACGPSASKGRVGNRPSLLGVFQGPQSLREETPPGLKVLHHRMASSFTVATAERIEDPEMLFPAHLEVDSIEAVPVAQRHIRSL